MLTSQNCERCRAVATKSVHDYCARCSRNLCMSCMQAGCCGHVPALSGDEYAELGLPPPAAVRSVACGYCGGAASQSHDGRTWVTARHNAPCGRLCGAVGTSREWVNGVPVHVNGACACAAAVAAVG